MNAEPVVPYPHRPIPPDAETSAAWREHVAERDGPFGAPTSGPTACCYCGRELLLKWVARRWTRRRRVRGVEAAFGRGGAVR